MPTYEFECQDCGELTDVVLSIKDDVKETYVCEVCGGWLKRKWSPPAVFVK